MCFALFLGARVPPPVLPRSGKWGDGIVGTRALNEYNSPVKAHFTLPHVVYAESDHGCGCGFRHISYQNGWGEDYFASLPDYDTTDTQRNHLALAEFLRKHFQGEEFVEFYGCWEGDFALPEMDRRELTLDDLVQPGFHFHQLGYGRVRRENPAKQGGVFDL